VFIILIENVLKIKPKMAIKYSSGGNAPANTGKK
jgi:hypothetical protein